jgi:cysteine protease ATG4
MLCSIWQASAHYFVASRGSLVYYLDPHTTQTYVSLRSQTGGQDRHRSWHCEVQRRMNLRDIDASLTFGFYCRDEADFNNLCDGIAAMNMALGGYAAVSIAESKQQYEVHSGWDQDDEDMSSDGDSSSEDGAPLAAE